MSRGLHWPARSPAGARTLTLNDELMHQAGFDVDHYEAVMRRRERWRRPLGVIGSLVGRLAVEVGLRAPRSGGEAERHGTGAKPGRATLNDRLMREAGFEVEHYRAVERRRALRRRRVRAAVVRLFRFAAFLVAIAAALKLFGAQRHLPGGAAAVVSFAAGTAFALDWIVRGTGLFRFLSRFGED